MGLIPIRTDVDNVKTVLGETQLSDTEIQEFIEDAAIVIDRLEQNYEDLGVEELRVGEKYYACHLIAVREPRPGREANVQSFTVKYQEESGKGINSTWYGRRANEILKGRLENLSRPSIGVGSTV